MASAAKGTAFGRGFRALAPLWLGVIPFGAAYAITARGAGLSLLETQALLRPKGRRYAASPPRRTSP